jgi:ribosome biogenesis GTPase / thiamine phosphate phosphatase
MSGGERTLEEIGYDAHFAARMAALDGALVPARIAIAHGESYIAWTRQGICKAVLVGDRAAAWREAVDRPQVGDWVAGTYSDSANALLVEHLLERRTCLMRLAAGEGGRAQVIAANVDVVGIVSAFGDGRNEARDRRLINERRLQRYLTAVEQSRAKAVLIVNKSDLSVEPAAVVDMLGQLFPGVPVVVTSAARRFGLDSLAEWLGRGQTLGLVGMSGVGKSTLVNALLGRDEQRIGDVRDSDARGRHTTTHRELFVMENGALLIDTPGMRELGLWEAESVMGFDDVIAIAAGCRFTNCLHATEPGCAIRAALESGALSRERWDSYQTQGQKLEQQRHVRGRAAHRGSPNQPNHPTKRRGRR